MNFTAERDALNAALSRVAPVAQVKTIPILGCLKCTIADDRLCLQATDLDSEISESVTVEAGATVTFAVDAQRIAAFVKSLPPGAVLCNIDDDKRRMTVSSWHSKAVLALANPDEFPRIAAPDDAATFSMPASRLGRLIEAALPYVSKDERRHYLCGIDLRERDNRLFAAATDGNRLVVLAEAPPGIGLAPCLLPRPTAQRLHSLLKGLDDNVSISISQGRAQFTAGPWTLISKLIDGDFPEYTRVIGERTSHPIKVPVETLSESIERAERVASADLLRSVTAKLEILPGQVVVTAGGGEAKTRDEIDAQYDGPPINVTFQAPFLADAINTVGGDFIEVHIKDSGSPALFCRPGEMVESVTLMPVRA